MSRIFNPSFDANFIIWRGQGANSRSQNSATTREIASIISTGLQSSSSNYHDRLNLTCARHPHFSKLRSTSLAAWLAASEREFMNVMSKSRLQSLFFDNRPRIGKGQRGFRGLGLVDRRPKRSSDKTRLNVLRAKDISQVRAQLSIEQDNDASTLGANETHTRRDNKVGTEKQDDKVGTGGQDNKASIEGQDNNRIGDPGQDDKPGTGKRDDKAESDNEGAAEPATRACRTRAQRLLCRTFLFVPHSNIFVTFSSLEFVIGWLLSSGSITNSGLSVTSINRNASSSR